MSSRINSKAYWNTRFKTNWDQNHGPAQTSFFGKIAIKHLPYWFKIAARRHKYSICDAGCAEGEFASLLKKEFTASIVSGVDFSAEAIRKARAKFSHLNFFCSDINKLTATYDVVFCSNTLEHFVDPYSVISNLLSKTKKHLILLVPFQDPGGVLEHEFIFNYNSFPLLSKRFILTHFRVIDTNKKNSLWPGKQVLVIYSRSIKDLFTRFI